MQKETYNTESYRVLVGFCHSPVIAYSGSTFLLPETRADESCKSGRAVVLARYRLAGELEAQGAVRLTCVGSLKMPTAYSLEPSYAALTLKWMPWGDSYTVFAAADLAAGRYVETRFW